MIKNLKRERDLALEIEISLVKIQRNIIRIDEYFKDMEKPVYQFRVDCELYLAFGLWGHSHLGCNFSFKHLGKSSSLKLWFLLSAKWV